MAKFPQIPPASTGQLHYLEVLLIDCALSDRRQRNDFISLRVERPIAYLDELSLPEASFMIDVLIARKANISNQVPLAFMNDIVTSDLK